METGPVQGASLQFFLAARG